MEAISFLIFLAIAFNFFLNFMTGGPSGKRSKADLSDIKPYVEPMQTDEFNENGAWPSKSDGPIVVARAQTSHARSPWQNTGVTPSQASRAKSLEQIARKASHKNPVQRGRRGQNMDQNRHRHSDWGQKGDTGLMSGKAALIFLVILFAVLYVLSQITPEMLAGIGF